MARRTVQIGLALAVVAASSAAAAGITTMVGSSTDETDDASKPAHAVEHKEGVDAYHTAVKDWTACVQEHASGRADQPAGERERFDPTAACGEHPSPHDFGLTGRPDDPGKPDDAGPPDGSGKPEDAGKPDDVPRGPKPTTTPGP